MINNPTPVPQDDGGTTTLERQPHGGALQRNKKLLVPIDESTTLESQSLDLEAEKSLSPANFSTLKTIAKAIGKDGLSLEEACVIANVDFENFRRLSIQFPIIQKVVRIKETEYKHMLLRALATKARSGDDKMAQWLLERRYPDEFGASSKRTGGAGDQDLLTEAITFVQESGDNAPVVKKQVTLSRTRAVPSPDTQEIKQLKSFLS